VISRRGGSRWAKKR